MLLLASMSFWTVRAQGIVWSYYNLFQIARLPDEAFQRGVFKVFFTYAIPMLLVSNVPARLLVNKMEAPVSMLLLVGLCGLCLLVSEWGWRRSLRHYTSASS
jgi:ABC-2 type transport system permease protein